MDYLWNIDNNFFNNIVNHICPSELQLNKANLSDTQMPDFWIYFYLYLMVLLSLNDERDAFDFDIVNFLFLDGDVQRSTSYGVYISQLIRFG